jgi:hypothetical protein
MRPGRRAADGALAAVGARGVPEEVSRAVAASARLGFGAGAEVLFAAVRGPRR